MALGNDRVQKYGSDLARVKLTVASAHATIVIADGEQVIHWRLLVLLVNQPFLHAQVSAQQIHITA